MIMKKYCYIIISILLSTSILFGQSKRENGLLDNFLAASKEGDIKTVRDLINNENINLFINEGNNNGQTALMLASMEGNIKIVNLLLYAKANTDTTSNNGMTALMYAINNGYIDIARSLLSQNANPNIRINSGPTALIQASGRGYYSIVEMLLNVGANPQMYGRYIKDEDNVFYDVTPLMIASYNNHFFICDLLMGNGALLEPLNEYGDNALLYAVGMENNEIALKLIDNNINIDIIGTFQSYKNITPLALSSALGNYEINQKLLTLTTDIDKKMFEGKTALIWAIIGNNFDIVKSILEKNPNINAKDSSGKTSLMYASEIGNVKIVNLLIENNATIDILDNMSRTALSYAMEYANTDIVKILSEKTLEIKSVNKK